LDENTIAEEQFEEVDPLYDKYRPWSPKMFIGMMAIWTPLISGIALALNWRGLGKPQWVLPNLLLSIAVPVVAVGSMIFAIERIPTISYFIFFLQLGIFGTMLGAIIGYIIALADFQHGAYRRWYEGKIQLMLRQHYDIRPSLWKGMRFVIFCILFAWLIGVIAVLSGV
jgi:hypothetical protein